MRIRLTLLVLSLLLAAPLLRAQTTIECRPMLFYNQNGQNRTFTQALPTAWFAVRMSPQWDAEIDTVFIGFGINKVNSPTLFDTLQLRLMNVTPPITSVIAERRIIVPANFQGQIPDSYWIAELNLQGTAPQLIPPRQFYLAWRLLGSSQNTGRISLVTPAADSGRSIVISNTGAVIPLSTFIAAQVHDTCDLVAEARICYPNGTPVELSSFTVAASPDGALLAWTTATESGNHGFDIERGLVSDEGDVTLWERIGFVKGHGTTTSPSTYSYIDHDVFARLNANGVVRYRLRQVDYDGSFTYSPTRMLRYPSSAQGFTLDQPYPNPVAAGGRAVVGWTQPDARSVRIALHDITGRSAAVLFDGSVQAGYRSIDIPFSVPAGSYLMTLTSGDVRLARRITVVR